MKTTIRKRKPVSLCDIKVGATYWVSAAGKVEKVVGVVGQWGDQTVVRRPDGTTGLLAHHSGPLFVDEWDARKHAAGHCRKQIEAWQAKLAAL